MIIRRTEGMREHENAAQAGRVKAEKESKERGARDIRRRRRNNREATNRKRRRYLTVLYAYDWAPLHRGFKQSVASWPST
jgi:hypothetical protein